MDPSINTGLATDLSAKQDELATDLSHAAIAHRERQVRLKAADGWIRAMNRSFKGIGNKVPRPTRVKHAIEKFELYR